MDTMIQESDKLIFVPHGRRVWRVLMPQPMNVYPLYGDVCALPPRADAIQEVVFDQYGSPVQGPDGRWYAWDVPQP